MNVILGLGLQTRLQFSFSFSLTFVVPFRVAVTNCRASYSSLQFSKFSPSSRTPQLSGEFCLPQQNHYK